jgi:peptide/nickel transport system substrate-binding protein
MWSIETLGTIGNPAIAAAWKKVATMPSRPASAASASPSTCEDRELPLILGLRPVLKKAQWQGKAFDETTLEAPIGSGPYVVDQSDPGVFISYKRNPDWWGKDAGLQPRPVELSTASATTTFRTPRRWFRGVQGRELSAYREGNAAKWLTNYDFPAVVAGDVIKAEIPPWPPLGDRGPGLQHPQADVRRLAGAAGADPGLQL